MAGLFRGETSMKPIAIFQHFADDDAGHFLDFARRAALPLRVFRGDQGETLPASIRPFSALVSLGGPMSVNDRLDFIEHEAHLIDEALAQDIPVLGHCLGSQLLARALGAEIRANQPARVEIGWHRVEPLGGELADWSAPFAEGEVFQWHNENFTPPRDAQLFLGNANCPNQAFLYGPHLGMQFHIEITAKKILDWCRISADPLTWGHLPSVQSAAHMQDELAARVACSNRMADAVYQRWSQALYR